MKYQEVMNVMWYINIVNVRSIPRIYIHEKIISKCIIFGGWWLVVTTSATTTTWRLEGGQQNCLDRVCYIFNAGYHYFYFLLTVNVFIEIFD